MVMPVSSAAGTGAGGHVCALVDDDDARGQVASDWVRGGLEAGQRVLWVEPPEGRLRDWLDRGGVAWEGPWERGQLAVARPDEVFGLGSPAEIGQRLGVVEQLVGRALADGYTGLRLGVEVADALAVINGLAAQLELEAAWEAFTGEREVSLLCVYDPQGYGQALDEAVAAHPRGLADRQSLAEVRGGVVRLSGELDVLNIDRLGRFLEAAVSKGGHVLDLSGLTFIDVRGTTRLIEIGRSMAPDARLRVVSPPAQLRKIVGLMGWAGELDVVEQGVA